MRQQNGLLAVLLVIVVMAGFGALIIANAPQAPVLQALVPTEIVPTDDLNSWQNILREGFGDNSTPLPTIAIPTEPFVPPTLIPGDRDTIPLGPADFAPDVLPTFTPFNAAVTPTLPPATAQMVATQAPVTAQAVTREASVWNPPPLLPPLSRDPLGRDHYWLQRPVESNATNYGLFYYPYGSDGPNQESDWPVHHGIDMPNPVGETVRAAGSGEVIWAADGLRVQGGTFQNSPSYGNVVLIRHDFGYRQQPLFTLYAHLSAVLVERGTYVNMGDVIGLVGETGRVSGPHVHFEVRLGEDHYRATVNPVLWMVPYVGHGVIAGRVTDANGVPIQDADITVRNWNTGLVTDTTTSYVLYNSLLDVNADPMWNENFAIGDVPVGRYEVLVNIQGEWVSKMVDVVEGTTAFVELSPVRAATAQPAPSNTPES